MTDPITRLNDALEGGYRIEREIGLVVGIRKLPCGVGGHLSARHPGKSGLGSVGSSD